MNSANEILGGLLALAFGGLAISLVGIIVTELWSRFKRWRKNARTKDK